MATPFQPDYRHMLAVLSNRRPARLPIYEHLINLPIIEEVLGIKFAPLIKGSAGDRHEFFHHFCRFWHEMTYDTISYEVCITEILPGGGALLGERPGPIQTRADFERYPWDELPALYWQTAAPRFEALLANLPPGMLPLGGVGNGVFEISEDLVGFQNLAYMQVDDPQLFADVYVKIGDVMLAIWARFLERYGAQFAVCRMGDDLGFKTGTLVAPRTIRRHILPQYARIIAQIRAAGKPFLLHSCGKIFDVMDEIIALGINAKHSNEDIIAPFDEWIARYNDRIGLLGGIDLDLLCVHTPQETYASVLEQGRRYRRAARGWALGSGNSIPDYVPVENYLAMLRAAQTLRAEEAAGV
jgi:uroporphyrinogen decarboxylase